MFSFKFCEIFKSIFFTQHLWAPASDEHLDVLIKKTPCDPLQISSYSIAFQRVPNTNNNDDDYNNYNITKQLVEEITKNEHKEQAEKGTSTN